MIKLEKAWAIKWRQGDREHFLGRYYGTPPKEFEGCPILIFLTRREAREWVRQKFGYMKYRSDLRRAPHFWRMPRVVRIRLTFNDGELPCQPK